MADKFEQTSDTTREFTLEFLEKITDNFSDKHIIGRGGYGIVYKGVLDSGEEIALKKLHHIPGLDDTQFRNEFNNLTRVQHPNITRLVGYCYNVGHQRIKYGGEYIFALVEERILCFEYLPCGSLDKHITDESCGLEWHTRFNIIKGVCEGLNYLHNGYKDPIYHLDLKPANILLDKNMIPKIGDFGLSRLFSSTQTYVTLKIIGTPGYMPPEYIDRCEITKKFDVFSLGVIIIRIIAGEEGYSTCAHISSQEFVEHVHEKWGKRLQKTMSFQTSTQIKSCIEVALRCVEVDREKRPTIAEIIDELNKIDTGECSLTGQVDQNQDWNSDRRGRIVFSSTCRPLVPFDIFSCPSLPLSTDEELHLTDGVSSNYNGRQIPPATLKALLKSPKLTDEGGITDADVDAGHLSGLVFVSERDDGLETLYISLHFNANRNVKIFSLADIFGAADFSGARLEDSGYFGGGYNVGSRTVDHSLIYVSTKEPVLEPRSPWTVVYKTNLTSGKTERLTPQGVFDLSPAVSPSGKMVAVASFEGKRWKGEVENLKTDIYVMNVDTEDGLGRKLLIEDGGWPSWGSENIIFFHRAEGMDKISTQETVEVTPAAISTGESKTTWGVFRYNISTGETVQVTPSGLDAVTPAAMSETKVAVATIRKYRYYGDLVEQHRHIETFDMATRGVYSGPTSQEITKNISPESDHYNPFVLDGGRRIGYHRCRSDVELGDPRNLHKLESLVKDVGLFLVSGLFPTISKDGSKLAFVDHEFKSLWIADSQGLRVVYKERGSKIVLSPVWNQNPDKDMIYICVGPSFSYHEPGDIYSITNASGPPEGRNIRRLTTGGFNNAFPSSNPEGDRFVFRSTRDGGEEKHKNLYIMLDDTEDGEFMGGWETRLTKGAWTDTQCQWSPHGDWIVFSSTRDQPGRPCELHDGFDPGYFSVFLVKASDPMVVIRVMSSGADHSGHIHYPVFSPDKRSIAVSGDLAAVSVDPISLPRFMHVAQPYGDIFVVDIDPDDLKKNKDVKGFRRITHSRYEYVTPTWARTFVGTEPNAPWNMLLGMEHPHKPACPSGVVDMLSPRSIPR